MIRTTAVRLGIPVSNVIYRALVSVAIGLVVLVAFLFERETEQAQARVNQAYKTTLESVSALYSGSYDISDGLSVMAADHGYERIWVVSATGDILASNRPREVGTRLEQDWWVPMQSPSDALIHQTVHFGAQELDLFALHAPISGRRMAILTRSAGLSGEHIPRLLVFLGVGLVVWIIVAVALVIFFKRGISGPTRKLDEKALELLRGGTVPEAQWDRIHAETSAPLGGHADCMLDLARYVDHQRLSLRDMTSRFGSLFNSFPAPAFMLDRTYRIVDVNEAMLLATGRDSHGLIGQHVSVLEAWIMTGTLTRWLDRTSTSAVGLRRVPCPWIATSTDENGQENDDRKVFLTVSPAPVGDGPGHIVLVEGWASTLLEEPGTASAVSQATFDDAYALVQDRAAAPYVGQIPSLISSAFGDCGPAGGGGRYGKSREAAWPNPAEDLSLRPSMRSGDEVDEVSAG